MKVKYLFSSLTRIANLADKPFAVEPIAQESWRSEDFVVGFVDRTPSRGAQLELTTGRMIEITEGDLIVGAFGTRFATLEMTGDWRDIGRDGQMVSMTGAGLFGKVGSMSQYCTPPIPAVYRGHVCIEGRPVNMRDFAPDNSEQPLTMPVILLVGSSMSAGKTTSARIIIRRLTEMGLTVVGAKLTGAGRYRDILGMQDAGAQRIYDFVDVGLSSTICPEDEYRPALRQLLSMIGENQADVLVAEAGASPLEPYNGAVAIEEIKPHVRCMVLCASDPYSVLGVVSAFGTEADFVAGMATSTDAGVALIERLSGLKALNLTDDKSWPALNQILRERLGLVSKQAVGTSA